MSPEARAAAVGRKGSKGAIPAIVWDAMWAHAQTSALETAVATGLFDQLVDGDRTAAEVARATRCSPRGVRMLADALAAVGLLSKAKGRYGLTETARVFLTTASPASVAGLVGLSAAFRRPFAHLTEVVRTGEPPPTAADHGHDVFPDLVGALFPSSFAASRRARESLPTPVRSRVVRVLDVAAGSAAWSLAWAHADARIRVTALDLGAVLDVTRRYASALGCADRYEFLAGDLRTTRFGTGRYDLVILGQICHGLGPSGCAELVAKCARALAPGGVLLVADLMADDGRTGPASNLLFALNLLVGTTDGELFTMSELRAWMRAAGLGSVRRLDVAGDGPNVVVAVKPARARRRA